MISIHITVLLPTVTNADYRNLVQIRKSVFVCLFVVCLFIWGGGGAVDILHSKWMKWHFIYVTSDRQNEENRWSPRNSQNTCPYWKVLAGKWCAGYHTRGVKFRSSVQSILRTALRSPPMRLFCFKYIGVFWTTIFHASNLPKPG